MPIPRFKSRDEVPETFRESYIERNGEWVLDDSGYQSKNSELLAKNRAQQDAIEATTRALGGLTPEQIVKFSGDAKRAEETKAREAGDFDKLMAKREAEITAKYEPVTQERDKYKGELSDLRLRAAITDAAAKAGVIAADLPFVLDIVKGRRVRYDEQTGKAVVFDKDGDPTGLTVEKFFGETFKGEAPKFYEAAGGSGGGAGGGGGGGARLPVGQVALGDNAAFLANLDAIAKGTVKVVAA